MQPIIHRAAAQIAEPRPGIGEDIPRATQCALAAESEEGIFKESLDLDVIADPRNVEYPSERWAFGSHSFNVPSALRLSMSALFEA